MSRNIDKDKIIQAIKNDCFSVAYYSEPETPEFIIIQTKADVVEARHGKWQLGKSGCMYFCSQCSYAAHPREVDEWCYCPRCGMRMVAEDG